MIETYDEFVATPVRPSGETEVPLYPYQESYVEDRLDGLDRAYCVMTIDVPIDRPLAGGELVTIAAALLDRHPALGVGLRLTGSLRQFAGRPAPEGAVLGGGAKAYSSFAEVQAAAAATSWVLDGTVPLFRIGAAPDDAGRWTVGGWFHHAVLDGVSLDLLHRDIGRLAARQALEGNPRGDGSFVDYCSWLGTLHDTRWWASMEDFWRRHLAALPRFQTAPDGLHRIPADAETTVLAMDASASRRLLRTARESTIDPGAMVTARFLRGLALATDRTDVSVTIPTPSRDHSAIRDEVGFFASVIPVGATNVLDADLASLARSVGRQLDDAHPNQIFGYADLLDRPGVVGAGHALGLNDVEVNLTSIRLDRVIPDLPPGEVVPVGPSGILRPSMVLNVVFHARGAVLFMRSRRAVWSEDQCASILRNLADPSLPG